MSSFRVGFTEFDYGPHEGSVRYTGSDTLIFDVGIEPGTLAEANVIRWQMAGYLASDEPVAITWDDDDSWNGLYRIKALSITPIRSYLEHGWMDAKITAVRHVAPIIETDYTLTYRSAPTDYYIAAPSGWAVADDNEHAWVVDTDQFFLNAQMSINGPSNETATLEYGSKAAAALTEVQVQQAPSPDRWHLGACLIEAWSDDVGWWPLTSAAIPDRTDVRVTNGAIRLTPVVGERYVLAEGWTGTEWSQMGRLYFEWNGLDAGGFATRWQVQRAHRAQTVLRCPLVRDDFRAAHVDLIVTRGLQSATVIMSTAAQNWSVTSSVTLTESDGTDMATTLWSTDGLYRSTTKDGLRLSVLADDGTESTTTDDVTFASGEFARFGVAVDNSTRSRDEILTNYSIWDRITR